MQKGGVIHWATGYDLLVSVLLLGRERSFRQRLLDLAQLKPGEDVLDIGCGTGTLAIAAKRRVAPGGVVHGVDPSPEMIARAARKAGRAGVEVAFREGVAEALPYPDAHFDVVTGTMMWHHLPRQAREQCAREIKRVLKPGGRALVVDFGTSGHRKKTIFDHFHKHGFIDLQKIVDVLQGAGLRVVENGPVGFKGLNYVLAMS